MKLIGVVAALLVTVTLASAQSGLERLYVLDCGVNQAKDQARWSPGVNEGKPIEFSDNCYLIRHAKGVLLWDTGIADAVAAMPDGMVVANGAITQRRAKTLAAQLTEIGVKPTDITYVAVSHTHGDHVGNVALFPSSTILIQGAEYEWAMSQPTKPAFAGPRSSRSSRAIATSSATGASSSCRRPGTRRATSHCSWCCPRPARSCSAATPSTSATTGSTVECRR